LAVPPARWLTSLDICQQNTMTTVRWPGWGVTWTIKILQEHNIWRKKNWTGALLWLSFKTRKKHFLEGEWIAFHSVMEQPIFHSWWTTFSTTKPWTPTETLLHLRALSDLHEHWTTLITTFRLSMRHTSTTLQNYTTLFKNSKALFKK